MSHVLQQEDFVRPRPKSAKGNLPSQLSSPFPFHQSSASQEQTLSNSIAPNPSFASLSPSQCSHSQGGRFNPGTSSWSPWAIRGWHPAAQAGGLLTDLILRQAQLQEAKSPSCVPPKVVHGLRDETKGYSSFWKRVSGSGARRVDGTCHRLGAAGQ